MTRYVIVLVFLAATSLAHAKPVEDHNWIEVRTENFVIHSMLSKPQTLKTARYFELLREAIPASVLPWRRDKPVPKAVYLLESPRQINELGHRHDIEHYSDPGNGEFILIGANVNAFHAVDTAYLQFLVGNRSTPEHVLWYEEGLVGLFSNSRISDGKFLFGYSVTGASQRTIDRMFSDVDHSRLSKRRMNSLIISSWSLVRMLTADEQGLATFGERLRTYIEMTHQGNDPRLAFETTFGIPVEELGDRLNALVIDDCCYSFSFPLESLLPEFNPEVRKLQQAEVALGLGRVAASLGGHDKARVLFNIARTDASTRAAATAGLERLEQKNTQTKCPNCIKNLPKDLEYSPVGK